MQGYLLLIPECLLLVGALVALFGELLPGKDRTVAVASACLVVAAGVLAAASGVSGSLFGGLLVFDAIARFARVGIALLLALWLFWLADRGMTSERSREAVALALFSATGGMLLAASADLITLYMALELSTMPAYVLMGYRRRDVSGLEGSLKYFLMSLLTSLVMLYGLSFMYGLSGTTVLARIGPALAAAGSLGLVASVLAMVGFLAKLSAAPFHFWAPDSYAGAPAASVAFVSTAPKLAGAVALVRLGQVVAGVEGVALVLAIAAAASMILGNLAALPQVDLRRLMAYSGVAHSGYLLVAVAAGAGATQAAAATYGLLAAVFYALVYAVPSMAVMLVAAEEGVGIGDFDGLAARRPAVAWALVVWLLSLIGIPPLAGFFGKLHIFAAGVRGDLLWLVVIAVIASVISAGYYFRIIRAAFFGAPRAPVHPIQDDAFAHSDTQPRRLAAVVLVVATIATIALGVGASPLLASLGLSGP